MESKAGTIDGKRVHLEETTQIMEGTLMVPLRVVVKAFGGNLSIDEDYGVITVFSSKPLKTPIAIAPFPTETPRKISHDDLNRDFGMPDRNYKIYINGTLHPPEILMNNKGIALAPTSLIADALKIKVEWEPNSQSITFKSDKATLVMQINRTTYNLNGEFLEMDFLPLFMNLSSLVPVDVLVQAFGGKYLHDDQSISISSN